jgi:hypothetical protein
LRYCATSRKVAGSSPDGAIRIFHWLNPSGADSASSRNEYGDHFLRGRGGRCIGLTPLPPLSADCLEIGELQSPGTLRDGNNPVQGLVYLSTLWLFIVVFIIFPHAAREPAFRNRWGHLPLTD